MEIYWSKLLTIVINDFLNDTKINSLVVKDFAGKLGVAVVNEAISTGKYKKGMVLLKEIRTQCVEVIRNVDIRNHRKLVDMQPKSFPSWIRNNNYNIEYSDNGWVFYEK